MSSHLGRNPFKARKPIQSGSTGTQTQTHSSNAESSRSSQKNSESSLLGVLPGEMFDVALKTVRIFRDLLEKKSR